MRVLGIDPGLATMGWGVVEGDHGRFRLVDYGAVITTPDMYIPERLHGILTGVRELIAKYQPQ